jgi:hypothetical protein
MPRGFQQAVIVFCSLHTHMHHTVHTCQSLSVYSIVYNQTKCARTQLACSRFYQQSSRWAWAAAAAAAAAPHLPRTPCCTARRIPRQVFKQHPAVLTAAAAALHSRHCSKPLHATLTFCTTCTHEPNRALDSSTVVHKRAAYTLSPAYARKYPSWPSQQLITAI